MIYLGAHLSSGGGFAKMGRTAVKIGADTMQCFLRNPRGSRAKALDAEDLAKLRQLMAEKGFGPLVAHAPYIMNPCAKDPGIRALAAEMMAGDLAVLEHLPGSVYNFHPGSHVGQGVEEGCRLIAEMLNRVLRPQQQAVVLLETMAGKGTEMGRSFQELRQILDRVELGEKVGVCMDTCHMFDAGYDLVRDLDGVLEDFDRTVGLGRLKAVHLNDSMNPLGSRKDRHALIGQGCIGREALVRVMTHPALQGLPFVLETPTDDAGHGEEIRALRELG